jgi:hypothetical protein
MLTEPATTAAAMIWAALKGARLKLCLHLRCCAPQRRLLERFHAGRNVGGQGGRARTLGAGASHTRPFPRL